MKRMTTLLLLFALLLASCGNTQTSETQPAADTDPVQTETETINPLDTLPEADYAGAKYKMLGDTSASWWMISLDSEESTGEIVNDTVYERNLFVETRYNVAVTSENTDSAAGTLQKAVAAGSDEYAVMWELLNRTLTPAQSGQLRNLNEITTMDMSGQGWDINSVDALSINGKLFFACNDINIHTIEGCSAMFFSQKQVNDNALDNPYELVRENKWTLDVMWDMMKTVSSDANGNGTRDAGDTFGLTTGVGTYMFMLNGSDGQLVIREEQNGEDTFLMNLASEKVINLTEKISTILTDKQTTVIVNDDAWGNDSFHNDEVLFKIMFIGDLSGMREKMEGDFGVLPLPMMDEQQEFYTCTVESTSHCMSIPVTAADTDRIGVITEALALYSDLHLIDAYYNTTLKGKIARDEDTTEMLDILVNNRTFEYSILYQTWGVWPAYLPHVQKNGAEGLASLAESIQKKSDTAVAATINEYAKLEG